MSAVPCTSNCTQPNITVTLTHRRCRQCAASPEWTQLSARRAAAEHTARADMGRRGYWITVNGFGTFTMQGYAHNLHRLVCLWYRGPGHDRDKCLRCDYEPTHCF